MTNFEKVKEMLKIEDVKKNNGVQFTMCHVIHRLRNEDNCHYRSCSECVDWLEKECVVALTDVEKIILKNIDNKYKYMARCENGELVFFPDYPNKRNCSYWASATGGGGQQIFNHLFKFVKWEDEEPYNIKKLLKGQ